MNKQSLRTPLAFAGGAIVGTVFAAGIVLLLAEQHQRNAYDPHLASAVAARKAGDRLSAEAHYFAASALTDDDYVSYIGLGELFELAGRSQDARRMYQLAVDKIDARERSAPQDARESLQFDKDRTTKRLAALAAPQ